MTQDLVIGVDQSTTATKAIAFDARGRVIAEGRAEVALSNPRPGWFEQNPAEWVSSADTALRQVTRTIDAARIAAVAISNQRETFAPFDAEGRALRAGTVWLDERAKPQVRALAQAIGKERIHAVTGKPNDVVPAVYRFAWLRDNDPALWDRLAMLAEVHAVLVHHLTGEWATSTASADPLGALDMARLDWSDLMLEAAGVRHDQVPRLARPGEAIGEVTRQTAEATGLRAGTLVVAGGGDGQCAGTGTNMLQSGRAYVNLGTAVVSGSWGADYRHDLAFRTMTAVAEQGYIYETCLRSGTFLVNWLTAELFQSDPRADPGLFARLEAEAQAAGIGAGGLVLTPYWSGCMTPYWDADARGVIAGLSSSHKRGDIYRAMLEGVALEQAGSTDRVAVATGAPIDQYVAIGGGAASDLWLRILADASGRPVLRSATVEASALGAGVAAAVGAGWFASFADAAQEMAGEIVRVTEPDPARAARYRELLALQQDLWPTLAAWNARLAAFVEAGAE